MARRGNQNFNRRLDLDSFGSDVSAAAKKALADGADIIVADAKSMVHDVSGDLKASIIAQPNSTGTKIIISANAKNKKGKMYGRLVEFWPGREHPFMYPAYAANRGKIRQSIIDAIREAVQRHGVS